MKKTILMILVFSFIFVPRVWAEWSLDQPADTTADQTSKQDKNARSEKPNGVVDWLKKKGDNDAASDQVTVDEDGTIKASF